MPPLGSDREEMAIQAEQLTHGDAWDLYIQYHVDEEGRHRDANNLTRQEAAGRADIMEAVKNRKWTIYATDKSGKLVLDTVPNFLEAIKLHY